MDAAHPDTQWVLLHERLLVFPAFDEATAWALGSAIRELALAEGVGIAIDIRRGDDCLFFHAMPGTSPANADWARRKRNLVHLLHSSSYLAELELQAGVDWIELMGLPRRDHTASGGCFPIRVIGSGVVGTATVSGLPSRDDHRLVVSAAADLLGIPRADIGC